METPIAFKDGPGGCTTPTPQSSAAYPLACCLQGLYHFFLKNFLEKPRESMRSTEVK